MKLKFKRGDRIYYSTQKIASPNDETKGVIIAAGYGNFGLAYTIKWDDDSRNQDGFRWHKDVIENNYSLVEDEAEQTLYRLLYE